MYEPNESLCSSSSPYNHVSLQSLVVCLSPPAAQVQLEQIDNTATIVLHTPGQHTAPTRFSLTPMPAAGFTLWKYHSQLGFVEHRHAVHWYICPIQFVISSAAISS
jgi:hypothetical protein